MANSNHSNEQQFPATELARHAEHNGCKPLPASLAELVNMQAAQKLPDIARPMDTDIVMEVIRTESEIDLSMSYCSKTGQPVANMLQSQLDALVKLHNVQHLREIADKLDLATQVSPLWLYTDNENLERLEDLDPRGFFCYCANLALQNHAMTYTRRGRRCFASIEVQRTFRRSLIKAWYATAAFSETELREANATFRRFLYLNLHNSQFYRLNWQAVRDLNGNDTPFDADNSPILPHELATSCGIGWIKNNLESALRSIQHRKAHNSVRYNYVASIPLASIFKKKHWAGAFERDVLFMLADIDIAQPVTLSMMVAKGKQLLESQSDKINATKPQSDRPGKRVTAISRKSNAVQLDIGDDDFGIEEHKPQAAPAQTEKNEAKLNILQGGFKLNIGKGE